MFPRQESKVYQTMFSRNVALLASVKQASVRGRAAGQPERVEACCQRDHCQVPCSDVDNRGTVRGLVEDGWLRWARIRSNV